jgi:transposase-like protein
MAGQGTGTTAIACPHCHKPFAPRLLAGGRERHRGFKCPHCKLFVPESRAEDAALARDTDR